MFDVKSLGRQRSVVYGAAKPGPSWVRPWLDAVPWLLRRCDAPTVSTTRRAARALLVLLCLHRDRCIHCFLCLCLIGLCACPSQRVATAPLADATAPAEAGANPSVDPATEASADSPGTARTHVVPAIAVASGGPGPGHCAVHVDGSVACWGAAPYPLLDLEVVVDPGTGVRVLPAPTRLPGIDDAVAVALGNGPGCVQHHGGELSCWGVGSPMLRRLPLEGVVGLGSDRNANHMCAVTSGGRVACWGENARGQLGVARPLKSDRPVWVAGVAGARAVAVGDSHSCALLASGEVTCWGDNGHGQLDGRRTARRTAGLVGGIRGATALSATGWHTCVLDASSAVRCWGKAGWDAGDGCLIAYGKSGHHAWPTPPSVSLRQVQATAVGVRALDSDGRLWEWRREGTCGEEHRFVGPQPVTTPGPVTAVSEDCAIAAEGEVYCAPGPGEPFAPVPRLPAG